MPTAALLKDEVITLALIDAHLYKPSPFFQGQYVSFGGKTARTIALEGTALSCISGFDHPAEIRVLSEVRTSHAYAKVKCARVDA